MKIGLLADGFMEWNGGIDFLLNIHNSLLRVNAASDIVVIVPRDGLKWRAKNALRAVSQMRRGVQNKFYGSTSSSPSANAIAAFSAVSGREYVVDVSRTWRSINSIVEKEKIEVLLPSFRVLPDQVRVPWIGYLYDLQHRYLTTLFSENEKKAREKHFRAMIESKRHILVNSRAVKEDLIQLYGADAFRVIVLPFNGAAPEAWFALKPESVAEKYNIGMRYFIICNQFWKHKDHGTAFRAFASLADRVPNVCLVCTGSTFDYRDPGYFQELMRFVSSARLQSKIRILGLIPKLDQIALMRGAIAVLQPTLFEGGPGGGAVFDAIAVGSRAIVSDIKVNRELEDPRVRFFKASDAGSLLNELMIHIESCEEHVSCPPSECVQEGVARQAMCGETIMSALYKIQNDF